jgi:hypothetical protein
MDLINIYYPQEEMAGYMNELKGKWAKPRKYFSS